MQRPDEGGQRYFSLPDESSNTIRRCVYDRSRPADRRLVAVACTPQDAQLIADALNTQEGTHVDTV